MAPDIDNLRPVLSEASEPETLAAASKSFETWFSPPTSNGVAANNLLVLDYDGTLTPIVQDPSTALLTANQHETLRSLASKLRTRVWIVSGRDRDFLSEQFSHPEVGLVAEHGAFMRQPYTNQWTDLMVNVDLSWMPDVQAMISNMCRMIPRTRLEMKTAAVVWHWRDNKEEGALMAPALKSLIDSRAQHLGWSVKVSFGKCVVEVRPESITKAGAVRKLLGLEIELSKTLPRRVFCAGDDVTDEGKWLTFHLVTNLQLNVL